jgi:hypothetical protein
LFNIYNKVIESNGTNVINSESNGTKVINSNVCLNLYKTIIQIASKYNEMNSIISNILNIQEMISEFNVSPSEASNIYLLLSQSLENKNP